ncbi:MAG TPA: hypothetical protein VKB45_10900 [Gemmatimonadales bacterium]|nr:hypothetical protein [Gemmatimonadales bacterium]
MDNRAVGGAQRDHVPGALESQPARRPLHLGACELARRYAAAEHDQKLTWLERRPERKDVAYRRPRIPQRPPRHTYGVRTPVHHLDEFVVGGIAHAVPIGVARDPVGGIGEDLRNDERRRVARRCGDARLRPMPECQEAGGRHDLGGVMPDSRRNLQPPREPRVHRSGLCLRDGEVVPAALEPVGTLGLRLGRSAHEVVRRRGGGVVAAEQHDEWCLEETHQRVGADGPTDQSVRHGVNVGVLRGGERVPARIGGHRAEHPRLW